MSQAVKHSLPVETGIRVVALVGVAAGLVGQVALSVGAGMERFSKALAQPQNVRESDDGIRFAERCWKRFRHGAWPAHTAG